MNLAERVAKYEERGFDRDTASINVLLEEALQVLFVKFPQAFVFFGGASLVLFYGSSRHSGDLDLLVNTENPPSAALLSEALTKPLNETGEALGFAAVSILAIRSGRFAKLAVKAGDRILFTIDLSRVSAVIKSELVESLIASDSQAQVRIKHPSRALSLLYKAEAFLGRSILKPRDAFDIKALKDSGARLSEQLLIHLEDGPVAEKLEDPEYVANRIAQVNSRTCTELEPYLPKELYAELIKVDFAPLREALREVFSKWL